MAGTLYCARHGRTDKVFGDGLCGNPRAAIDVKGETSDVLAVRRQLKVPKDICGRFPMVECPGCHHPDHAGRKCSTLGAHENTGTKWCQCDYTPPELTVVSGKRS